MYVQSCITAIGLPNTRGKNVISRHHTSSFALGRIGLVAYVGLDKLPEKHSLSKKHLRQVDTLINVLRRAFTHKSPLLSETNVVASILIIEDEPRLVSFLSQGLQRTGYQTLTVTNGKRALPLALSKMFDLVVLDLILPDSEGVSILRAIRAQSLQIPIIVVTALCSEECRSHAFLLGANEYLTKPFRLERLLDYIHAYI